MVLSSLLRAAPRRAVRSLRIRNYRLFFAGHVISVSGTWMQRVGQDWLVLRLTDDAVALGVTTALQFGPMLVLGMFGGLLVDRVDRRRVLFVTQTIQIVLAAALAVLTLGGWVTLWIVYLLALLLGLVTVVDAPARQAFVGDLVGPEDIVNAQALNSTAHNAGRLVGPAIAGLVIAWVGVGAAFALNAVSFVSLLIGLARMDPAAMQPFRPAERGRGQARAGVRYVWSRPALRAGMLLVLTVALLGQHFRIILPVLAKETFEGGAETYGTLMGMLGLGAVLGALTSAARERVTLRSLQVAASAFGAAWLFLSAAPTLTMAYAAVVAVGFASLTFNTLGRTLLQVSSERSMHGRVLALYGAVFMGSQPVGGPLMGWIIETWGARAGMLVGGTGALLAAAAMIPVLRRTGPLVTPAAGLASGPSAAVGPDPDVDPVPDPGPVSPDGAPGSPTRPG